MAFFIIIVITTYFWFINLTINNFISWKKMHDFKSGICWYEHVIIQYKIITKVYLGIYLHKGGMFY